MTYTLDIPGELVPTNRTRRRHWAGEAEITRYWRGTAKQVALAAKVPRLDRAVVRITAHQVRGRLADPGAYQVQAKAAVDGLVDAGVFPDDDWTHIAGLQFEPGVRVQAKAEGLRIELEEVADDA